ncbi:signal recognition particle receptor subunit alpha, partial [Candidatus Woesearchaeota archaeon]|nr:signal recognition particle receptor subunit alpha [Candidatus Woesearchaeota archaeon]
MALEKLSESLRNTLAKIARAAFVDDKLIDELTREIQRALLQADVNVQLVFSLTKSIKERALKEKPPAAMSQREYVIKIVYDELVQFLGGEGAKIEIQKKPFKIMLVGLYGSGKTTTIGKLAKYYKKLGLKVASLGLDVYRPAAPEQLEQISKQIEIPYFIKKGEKDPVKIYKLY